MQSWAGDCFAVGKPTPWGQFSCCMPLVLLSFGSLEMQTQRHGNALIWETNLNYFSKVLWGFFFSFLGEGGGRAEQVPRKQAVLTKTQKRRKLRRFLLMEKSLLHCNHYFTKRSDSIRTLVISIHLLMKAYLRTMEELVTDPGPTTAQSFWQTLKLIRFFPYYCTGLKGPNLVRKRQTPVAAERGMLVLRTVRAIMQGCKPDSKSEFQSNIKEKGKVTPFQDQCWALDGDIHRGEKK